MVTPCLALAQAQPCSPQGYSVFYVNGIFDTKMQAQADADALWYQLGHQYNSQPLTVYSAYNQSHIGGLGDLAETVAQMLFSSLSDLDLHTMLRQMAGEDTTQKLVVVGHSQGALYANQIYNYVTAHGEAPKSVVIYAVATPANYVAGGGSYVTSQSDAVIFGLTLAAQKAGMPVPLPPNMDTFVDPATSAGLTTTHAFIAAYLFSAGDRIVSDIGNEMKQLQPSASFATLSGCFTPPPASEDAQAQAALSILDPAVNGIGAGITMGVAAISSVANSATAIILGAINVVEDLQDAQKNAVANTSSTLTSATTTAKSETIINKLYGSSLEGLSPEDKKELLGSAQGSAVALALAPAPKLVTSGVVLGTSTSNISPSLFPSSSNGPIVGGGGGTNSQTAIVAGDDTTVVGTDDTDATGTSTDNTDDNAEASTTPPVLFDASTTAPVLSVQECAHSISDSFCLIPTTTATLNWLPVAGATSYEATVNGANVASTADTSATVTLADQASSTLAVIALDASSTPLASADVPVYVYTSPVVINEIEWAGDKVDPAREWFELKNRTPYEINLSNVALYAEDGGSQYIPLAGTMSEFFIVERIAGAPAMESPKVEVNSFDQLADSGEQIALGWQNGTSTIKLDETPAIATCNGWCAGSTVEDSGVIGATLSMERVSADASGLLQSNWASNDTYSNVANMPGGYGEALYATLGEDNSGHLPEVGWLCNDASTLSPLDPRGRLITPGGDQVVHSSMPGATCSYLGRFITWPGVLIGGVFKGDVGSSTLVSVYVPAGTIGDGSAIEYGAGDHLENAQNGDHYFVAIWQERMNMYPFPDDVDSFISYFTIGHRLTRDSQFDPFTIADDTNPPHDVYRTIPFTFEQ